MTDENVVYREDGDLDFDASLQQHRAIKRGELRADGTPARPLGRHEVENMRNRARRSARAAATSPKGAMASGPERRSPPPSSPLEGGDNAHAKEDDPYTGAGVPDAAAARAAMVKQKKDAWKMTPSRMERARTGAARRRR